MSNSYIDIGSISHLLASANQLHDNLAGNQISHVLDTFLFNAIQPTILYTQWFLDELAQLYLYMIINSRRKFSLLYDRPTTLRNLFALFFLAPEERFTLYEGTELERTFQFYIADQFLRLTDGVEVLNNRVLLGDAIAQSELDYLASTLGTSALYLVPSYRIVRDNIKYANKFKQLIIGKYLLYAAKRAWKDSGGTEVPVDMSDLFKNYVSAISNTIDRYSHHNGALASYIDLWLINARTSPEFSHEIGQAYTITPIERKRIVSENGKLNNLGYPITSISEDKENEHVLEDHIIDKLSESFIIKRLMLIPGIELAMLYYNIPINISKEDFIKANEIEIGKI